MKTLVEILIYFLFHKASSELFKYQQICSPYSVVLQFYIVLSAIYINQFANNIRRVGAIKLGLSGYRKHNIIFFKA